jgi:hypothetical protein
LIYWTVEMAERDENRSAPEISVCESQAVSQDVRLLAHLIKQYGSVSSMLTAALMCSVWEPSMKSLRILFVLTTLVLPFGTFGSPALAEPHTHIAQGEVTIPTNAQINRLEQQAITTPPLDDSEGALQGGQATQIRQMDQRAHRIDEKLLKDDGVCDGC